MTEYITEWTDNPPDIFQKEEVVRCRDCKHSANDGVKCYYFAATEWNDYLREYVELPSYVEPSGFCAWAVRRDV